jgi:site-specific recombinase XerD
VRYFAPYELRHTFPTRLSAGGVADHMVTQMLRQGDAEVFKLYSQAKLGMMREALAKLDRQANKRGVTLLSTIGSLRSPEREKKY